MQIGLQKRLRARNSLFDLVGRRNIDRLSSPQEQSVDDIPPLPASPLSPPSPVSSEPEQSSADASLSLTMAPVRRLSMAVLDQIGVLIWRPERFQAVKERSWRRSIWYVPPCTKPSCYAVALICRGFADNLSNKAPSTLFPGTSSSFANCPHSFLTSVSPVIVAENMLGCAMYEMV